MDNFYFKDNLTVAETGIPGGAVVDSLGSTLKNMASGIRNKAKAREAKKVSDAGQYWTLRPFLKSLIPIPQYVLDQVGGQGITESMVINLPAQQTPPSGDKLIQLLKGISDKNTIGAGGVIGVQTEQTPASEPKTLATDYKKYIPWIFVVLLIGGIAWALTHQVK